MGWRLFERPDGSRFWAVRRSGELIEVWYGTRRAGGRVVVSYGTDDDAEARVARKLDDGYVPSGSIGDSEGPSEARVRRAREVFRESHARAALSQRLLNSAARGDEDDVIEALAENPDLDLRDSLLGMIIDEARGPRGFRIVRTLLDRRDALEGMLHFVANRAPGALGPHGTRPAKRDPIAEKLVRYLLERGADIEERDGRGWTPLHVAAANLPSPTFVMMELLENGADANGRTNEGSTPLHLAVSTAVDNDADRSALAAVRPKRRRR